MKKVLFYGFCIAAISAYCLAIKFVMTEFGAPFGYGIFAGALLMGILLFTYDRHVGRISGDPDNLRWWEAPAKRFIDAEKAGCRPGAPQDRAVSGYLPPAAD